MTYFAKPGIGTEAVRACDLKYGDAFEVDGIVYIVTKVSDRIYYRARANHRYNTFGLKSQKLLKKLLYAPTPRLPKSRL